jgi:hypothetical protein
LGLPFPDRGCLQALVEGWVVRVRAGSQQLTYRTDSDGSTVYLDETNASSSLPQIVAEAVKREAAQQTQRPVASIQMVSAEAQTWPNGCLGLEFPDLFCTQALVEGWLVRVRAGSQQLTYRTDSDGSTVYLEDGVSVLPTSVREAVLDTAKRDMEFSGNSLAITRAVPRLWDGCLGVYEDPNQLCTKVGILGWQVAVEGENHHLVYHTNGDGSDVRFNVAESHLEGNSNPKVGNSVPFSPGDSPPPLPTEAVFRAVSVGGIAGEVREITLWKDGKILIQSARSGNPQTRWISPQQVQQFQQILGQQRFVQYNRLSFPPPQGSADMIEVTLSSRQGVMRYADYGTENFPQPLQVVLTSWQELLSSAREQAPVGGERTPTAGKSDSYPWMVERFLLEWFGSLF